MAYSIEAVILFVIAWLFLCAQYRLFQLHICLQNGYKYQISKQCKVYVCICHVIIQMQLQKVALGLVSWVSNVTGFNRQLLQTCLEEWKFWFCINVSLYELCNYNLCKSVFSDTILVLPGITELKVCFISVSWNDLCVCFVFDRGAWPLVLCCILFSSIFTGSQTHRSASPHNCLWQIWLRTWPSTLFVPQQPAEIYWNLCSKGKVQFSSQN